MKKQKNRCEILQKHEKYVSIAIAPVGVWVPWDPSPDAIQDSEYMLPELNKLMKSYNEQNRNRDLMFEERKTELMQGSVSKSSNQLVTDCVKVDGKGSKEIKRRNGTTA